MGDAKPKILIADDSKVVRVSAQRILADEFDLVLAEDGEAAYELLAKDRSIEAVFTDLGMPRLDGYGLVERLRGAREERLRVLPIIVVTANETDEARQRALGLGATDFITKPFNKVDLTARAKAHVEHARRVKAAKAETKQVEQLATIDALTRLGNRQHFDDKFMQARAFTLRHKQAMSLMRVELDHAKPLAAKLGQTAFDSIIKELGALLRTTVRTEDSAARIGVGSFVVVLMSCDAPGAQALAQRLMRLVEAASARHAKRGISYHISIGLSTPSENPDLGLKDLVAHTEEALQQAVGQGGGRIVAWAARGKQPVQPPALVPLGEAPSLERALEMITAGNTAALLPHIPALLKRLVPLLKLASRQHKQALAAYLDRSAKGK
jgi:two-component system, cell cycle response regulator